MKYWFRSIEQCAPWVNRIYFVTNGQLPEWLNLEAEKLVHVRHSDYMPEEYLPTFNVNPIELNLHRIPGLSEHFVYFNDDLFLLKPVGPEYFFRNGLPVFASELRPIIARRGLNLMASIYINNISVINERFKTKEITANKKNWFSLRSHSWKAVLKNAFYSHFDYCVGFRNPHFAVPTRKSTMELLWREEPALLDATSRRRFRDSRDVTQYLFRYWQYATNQFAAERADRIGKYYELTENSDEILQAIREKSFPQICINDTEMFGSEESLIRTKEALIAAFDSIFPNPSQYEI